MSLFSIPFMKWQNRRLPPQSAAPVSSLPPGANLAEIPPGRGARVSGFHPAIPANRLAHLQSYGLVPGATIRVIQHSPVTIIQVDNLELALERDLARLVHIDS